MSKIRKDKQGDGVSVGASNGDDVYNLEAELNVMDAFSHDFHSSASRSPLRDSASNDLFGSGSIEAEEFDDYDEQENDDIDNAVDSTEFNSNYELNTSQKCNYIINSRYNADVSLLSSDDQFLYVFHNLIQ